MGTEQQQTSNLLEPSPRNFYEQPILRVKPESSGTVRFRFDQARLIRSDSQVGSNARPNDLWCLGYSENGAFSIRSQKFTG
jgi:hypothetical protein